MDEVARAQNGEVEQEFELQIGADEEPIPLEERTGWGLRGDRSNDEERREEMSGSGGEGDQNVAEGALPGARLVERPAGAQFQDERRQERPQVPERRDEQDDVRP